MTLEPGDIVTTGTPAGVGLFRKPPVFMQPGDVVEIEAEGIGVLRTRIVGMRDKRRTRQDRSDRVRVLRAEPSERLARPRLRGADLVAVCDTDRPRRRERREPSACPLLYGRREMFARERLDLVDIVDPMRRTCPLVRLAASPRADDRAEAVRAGPGGCVDIVEPPRGACRSWCTRTSASRRRCGACASRRERRDRQAGWARISFRTGYDVYQPALFRRRGASGRSSTSASTSSTWRASFSAKWSAVVRDPAAQSARPGGGHRDDAPAPRDGAVRSSNAPTRRACSPTRSRRRCSRSKVRRDRSCSTPISAWR